MVSTSRLLRILCSSVANWSSRSLRRRRQDQCGRLPRSRQLSRERCADARESPVITTTRRRPAEGLLVDIRQFPWAGSTCVSSMSRLGSSMVSSSRSSARVDIRAPTCDQAVGNFQLIADPADQEIDQIG